MYPHQYLLAGDIRGYLQATAEARRLARERGESLQLGTPPTSNDTRKELEAERRWERDRGQ